MKKRIWRRVFTMLLVVVLVFSNSAVSFAEWDEDWDDNESCKCFYCEDTLRDPDDYCQCDMGAPHCSESHNSGCWESLHCANFDECGQTIEDSSICDDCGLCKDCQEKEGVGTHCSECGNCGSPICDECSDDDHLICKDCAEMQGYHCIGCGGCFQSIEVCEKSADEDTERAMCKDCCEAAGNHCTECHEHVGDGTDVFWCFCDSGPGDHCGYCGMEDNNGKHCEGCDKYFCVFNGDDLSKFCDECDMCFDCCFEQVKHCPICENEVSERCESDGEHCTDCCDLCEQCERCLLAEDIERCEHCDLCLECCRENAEEAGCGCGEYCKEESGFEEHLCEECGICFGVNPKCEYCGFCEICCLEKSEEAGCSEGMCVEDPDFEDHFCSECNACFHSVDRCGTCEAANVNVCENCCASISSDLGCGHGICPNSDYWNCHFDSETSECYVNEDEYGEDQHDFRNSTTCYVCGAQRDGRPHILVHPKNRTVKVGKDAASAEKAVFSVTAQGSNLTYQWYTELGSKITDTDFYKGTTSSQLTVATNICNADIDAAIAEAEAKNDTRLVNTLNQIKKLYSYYCVVTNSESGLSVKSDTAVLTSRHNVSEFRADKGKYHSAQYKIQNGDAVKVEWTTSDSHCKTCVGGWYNASDEDAIILKMVSTCDLHEASEPHVWTSWNYNTEYPAYKGQNGYASRSCMVCKTVEYKAYEYVEPHEHVWANKPELFMTTIKQKDGSGKVTEVPYDGYHARRCTVEGCPEYSEKEEHIWSEYEIKIAATDHSQGERVRHCLVCGYVQTETISPLYHKHDFPVKNPLTGWYDSDDMPYVYHSNRTHYVTCKGVVYNEKTGAYEPCPAKANYEQHSLTMEYIDGDNYPTHWAKFRFTCRCGFSKVYKTDDTPNINYDDESIGVYRLFSTFPNFKWTFNKETHYSSDTGNPAKIPNGAEVTIYNETGYRLNRGTWQDCIYTVDDRYINFKDFQFYEVTFIMPMRDVFVDFQLLDPETLTDWECPHQTTTYYDQATAIETTCTKSGKDPDLKCSECHVTLEVGKTHAALGHNFVLDKSTIVYSTCTAKGYTGDSICANCGKKQKGIETPAEGHDTKDCYYWDDNKHWPYCGVCDKEFKAQADKHRFDVTVVSQGVTYEMCSICKFYRVKEGIATGRNYTHTVYVNDDSDNVNVRVRFYPTTVSDEDIAKDMEKETSELGTEYGCLVSDNYKTSIYPGYTRCIQYDVLNAPQNQSNTYYKIAVTLGKEYIPYIVERNNFNLTGYLRLKEYTVSFQANGGSGSMESVTVKSGATYTLPECGFGSTGGKTFVGWRVMKQDQTTLQNGAQPGTSIQIEGNVICKAIWKDNSWTSDILLDSNSDPSMGGRIFVDKESVEDLTMSSEDLMEAYTGQNYVYAWYADGEEIPDKTGSSIVVTGDLAEKTIYAVLKIAGREFKTDKMEVLENPGLGITFRHNCEFDNNIAMHYAIPKSELEGCTNLRLVIDMEKYAEDATTATWKQYVVSDYADDYKISGTYYYHFTFPGIGASEMGNLLKARLVYEKNGETVESKTDVFSIKDYAYDRLKKSSNATYKTIMVDMLNYGAAAQVHFKKNAANPVNAELTDKQREFGSSMEGFVVKSVENVIPLNGTPKAHFDKKNVMFDTNVVLVYRLDFSDFTKDRPKNVTEAEKMANVKVVCKYNNGKGEKSLTIPASQLEKKNGMYLAYCNVLTPAEMGCTVNATIYDGDQPISDTFQYSIESYVSDRLEASSSDTFKDLLRKMVLYGRAVKEHFK